MYFWDRHKTINRYYESLTRSICDKYDLTQMEYDILMFLRLLVLGFSASFLLVEVMNRYTFIVYPVLIIISAMCINDLIDKFVIGKGQFMHK